MANTDTVYENPYRPIIRMMVLDVSSMCSADFLARCGGAFYDVYFFDECRRVHLCEATASAELHFIGGGPAAIPEDEDAREALYNEIIEIDCNSEEVTYMWHSTAMRSSVPVTEIGYHSAEADEVGTEEEYLDEIESWREFFRGNSGAESAVDHWLKARKA